MIRQPRMDEAQWLSELALRSKAWWGYDAIFIEACREELTITVEQMQQGLTWVLEKEAMVAGFYRLAPQGSDLVMLDLLFVDPPHIGKGIGKTLWEHATAMATQLRFKELQVVSDPGALVFYKRMGAELFDRAPSGSIAGRRLPKLRFSLVSNRLAIRA